jgi:hypothetical protein
MCVRLLAFVILVGLVVGCGGTPGTVISNQKPVVRPEVLRLLAAVEASALPPGPQVITIYWRNWPGATVTVIERSRDLVTWEQIGRVTNSEKFAVTTDGHMGVFRVGHPAQETHHWFDPVLNIYKHDY